MDNLKSHFKDFLSTQSFDAIAFARIDFSKNIYESFQIEKFGSVIIDNEPKIYFDLASLSKPLTNGIGYLIEEKNIPSDLNLVLNHKGSLPAWGLLPKHGWEDIINSFPISEGETLYSDYSALRFMLEYNKLFPEGLHKKVKRYWDNELLFWKDLASKHRTIQNGFVKGRPNSASVHDPNAFNLNTLVSHAGLFGTIDGVSKTLLKLDSEFKLIDKMNTDITGKNTRFVHGWDTVSDCNNTLAGNGCGQKTFGHLGFTGTSIWIDPQRCLGYVLLTNATKSYWFDKKDLNEFRKNLGSKIWKN